MASKIKGENIMAKKCIPVASVLSIAAAGSETSKGCVITNEKNGEKRAYDDNLARPKFAIMNPEYTKTLPDYQKKATMMDAFCHGVEAFWSVNATKESKELSKMAIQAILKN